jgi:4'-phosphopantetheinyl transferase EntD
MLHDIVPSAVAVAESFADLTEPPLFAEESAVIARAVDKRRREFTTTRICARTALARLGLPPGPILPGPRGAPRWPAAVVGSLTHTEGYRAAAVARVADLAAIGIDAEPDAELPDGVLSAIALDDERLMVEALRERMPDRYWDRLLFCAKEAVYKVWFPLTQAWLDFTEARVTLHPAVAGATGRFAAELLVPGPVIAGQRLAGFTGRWVAANGLLVTAITVPAGAAGEAEVHR